MAAPRRFGAAVATAGMTGGADPSARPGRGAGDGSDLRSRPLRRSPPSPGFSYLRSGSIWTGLLCILRPAQGRLAGPARGPRPERTALASLAARSPAALTAPLATAPPARLARARSRPEARMIYETPDDWQRAPHKRVALFGMSGLGKTRIAAMLREEADWFHYSVDFRIGTRYMGEHIVDNFKREAMRNPFLRQLLRSDSIYIASNITFQNLDPLSTYLGKPGDPAKGGIPFDEYLRRQRQHRGAEISRHPRRAPLHRQGRGDLRLRALRLRHLGLALRGRRPRRPRRPGDARPRRRRPAGLVPRHRGRPRGAGRALRPGARSRCTTPRASSPASGTSTSPTRARRADEVDPDAFIRHGFRALMAHRLPRYAAMAARWGVTVEAAEVAAVRDPQDFDALVAAGARPPMTHEHHGHARPLATTTTTPPAPAPSASPRSSPAASWSPRSPAASSPARSRSSPTPATC